MMVAFIDDLLWQELVQLVSFGGNMLLDIGPTADGRVPVIMQGSFGVEIWRSLVIRKHAQNASSKWVHG